jgi:hypothetical protein
MLTFLSIEVMLTKALYVVFLTYAKPAKRGKQMPKQKVMAVAVTRPNLMEELDALARKNGLSRSKFVGFLCEKAINEKTRILIEPSHAQHLSQFAQPLGQ